MPCARANAHAGHFEKCSIDHLSDLDAVAVLRFYVRQEPLEGRAQRLLPIESEDGAFDLSRQEEKCPSGLLNLLLERGPCAVERCPAVRIGLAAEPYGVGQA